MVDTARLRQHVWTSGPDDGRPLLLVHGNITTGGFWRYVAQRLPADVRGIAPDLRAFGRTEPKPVDPRRGCATWPTTCTTCSRRLVSAAEVASTPLAGRWVGAFCSSTSSTTARDLASVTLIAPISPYGLDGCRGVDGEPC